MQNVDVHFRTDSRTRQLLEQNAVNAGKTMSESLRDLVWGYQVPPKIVLGDKFWDIEQELRASANNLNQIAHWANMTGNFDPVELGEEIRILRELERRMEQRYLTLGGTYGDFQDLAGKILRWYREDNPICGEPGEDAPGSGTG